MSELPTGWAAATLDDLGEYLNGMAFKPEDWTEAGFPIIRIQNLTNPNRPLNRTKRPFDDRYRVQAGDLLISWSATLDAFIWDGEDAVLNQHIFKVTPSSATDPKFLYYAGRQAILDLISSDHLHGSTMKHINRGPFLAHELGLPPLAEQRRIAAKLDALTARTARARADLDRIPALTVCYKEAVLAKAFNGELTARWRDQGGGPSEWVPVTLGSVATVSGGKRLPAGHDYAADTTAHAYIRVSNFSEGTVDTAGIRYLEPSTAEILSRYRVRSGDLCISIAGTIGQVVSIPEALSDSVLTENAARIRLERAVDERFLRHFLSSPAARAQIVERTVATAVAKLALFRIEQIQFGLPRMGEQHEIVRRIDAAFAEIDRLTAEAAAARRLLDRLDQAILAKAFRGELVPQDPADEPASVLLERIRAERAAAPKAKRGRAARAAA